MVDEIFENVLDVLNELAEDTSLSKNLKKVIDNVTAILKQRGEVKMLANKALQELEELSDDSATDPYVRTQIWNIISLLEKICSC